VRTGSRLHFGLLSLPGEAQPLSAELPCRHYGGVGLMIQAPGLSLAAQPAPTWSAEGPLAERVLALAARFVETLPPGVAPQPCHLVVERSAPEHVGLGTGTQLGLATTLALAAAHGLGADTVDLARRVDRGRRSALGIHGFALGGFLVEAGKKTDQAVGPLIARLDFPELWRVVLILPAGVQGLHGAGEVEAFAQLGRQGPSPGRAETLCRLVLLGLLPALVERDLTVFGEALFEINRLVGEAFRPIQGGIYASPSSEAIVDFVRAQGVRGVGQSSWGPALFAVTGNTETATDLARRLQERLDLGPDEVLITEAASRGATVTGLEEISRPR
jgi:beta-ribofuranosylaminobenzene 5'-phosphate synthase